jgi:hypothetical protein
MEYFKSGIKIHLIVWVIHKPIFFLYNFLPGWALKSIRFSPFLISKTAGPLE